MVFKNARQKLKKGDAALAQETLDLLNNKYSKKYEYSPRIAALLASVSGWSYSDLDDFQRILSDNKQINLSEAEFVQISATNDSMFIVATAQIIRTSDKKTAIVCFRGTEPSNPVNWATDLNTAKAFYLDKKKRIKVHQGFIANFRSVWDGMEGVLAHLKNPSKMAEDADDQPEKSNGSSEYDELEAIYFTGHSLGAAMAFLAGLYISYVAHETEDDSMWKKVRGIYNYGQPMAIDPKSADFCDSLIGDRLFRMVYYNDIVPHAPAVSMGLYAHIGHEYRYHPWNGWTKTKKGETVTQLIFALPTIPFLAGDAIGKSILFPFSLFKSPWSLMDHLPPNYINSLHGVGRKDVRGWKMLGGITTGDEDEVVEDEITKPSLTAATTKPTPILKPASMRVASFGK